MVGRSWHAEHVCSFNLPPVSYSFWNKGRKVLKFWKFDEEREITPKWIMGFTSKLQGGYILIFIYFSGKPFLIKRVPKYDVWFIFLNEIVPYYAETRQC
jgi:hypothetical protein